MVWKEQISSGTNSICLGSWETLRSIFQVISWFGLVWKELSNELISLHLSKYIDLTVSTRIILKYFSIVNVKFEFCFMYKILLKLDKK